MKDVDQILQQVYGSAAMKRSYYNRVAFTIYGCFFFDIPMDICYLI